MPSSLPARSVARRAIAAATAALALVAAAPVAGAQPALPGIPAGGEGKEMVVFGDSYAANPTVSPISYARGYDPEAASRSRVAGQMSGCGQDPNSWPHVAARVSGVGEANLADYSCNGTGRIPAAQLLTFVETAISRGDVGPKTDKVLLMYGGLDAFAWADAATNGGNPASAFRATVKRVADRVRAVAPGAHVYIVGYPRVAHQDKVCLINTDPENNHEIIAPGLDALEASLNNTLIAASREADAWFINLYDATGPHSTCAKPSERYVSGWFDTTSKHNMKLHPTINGSVAIGHMVASVLK
ncbi:hypothetical protein KRX51_06985 [Corynebacterium sp. TAE3-ERU12]|uniref:GDSL-type esterase/lipase family protein n=1 Tax=Corynebacterium sp. TAE3-ERU12 TaxID=2849491 RepID=UPI001C48E927|nr:GDSL-type esterase/lipase family protein [Corynebacterium sp. TAE3-ERU12]MBV7295659.1 hypothetical protein [Corynebacterium sp. TAE3-ERU12]